jgi:methylated-DNA-[protein]-cysteine S-methyltransferase
MDDLGFRIGAQGLCQTVGMVEWTEADFGGLGLWLEASIDGIRAISFSSPAAGVRNDRNPLLALAVSQLRDYFASRLREFHLPLDAAGTPFQKRVWGELVKIPYGQTRTYAQVAAAIGSPLAVRAVGAANGANPIAIVVPCHRVIGTSGKLVGYGGGLALKRRLLELEGSWHGF